MDGRTKEKREWSQLKDQRQLSVSQLRFQRIVSNEKQEKKAKGQGGGLREDDVKCSIFSVSLAITLRGSLFTFCSVMKKMPNEINFFEDWNRKSTHSESLFSTFRWFRSNTLVHCQHQFSYSIYQQPAVMFWLYARTETPRILR